MCCNLLVGELKRSIQCPCETSDPPCPSIPLTKSLRKLSAVVLDQNPHPVVTTQRPLTRFLNRMRQSAAEGQYSVHLPSSKTEPVRIHRQRSTAVLLPSLFTYHRPLPVFAEQMRARRTGTMD